MRRVTVIYHWEPEGCWAESPDAPGFSAAAGTFAELREQVRGGLAFHFDGPVEVVEIVPDVEPAWSVSTDAEVVAASSGLWRRLVGQGTRTAGVLTEEALESPVGRISVRSGVAYA